MASKKHRKKLREKHIMRKSFEKILAYYGIPYSMLNRSIEAQTYNYIKN